MAGWGRSGVAEVEDMSKRGNESERENEGARSHHGRLVLDESFPDRVLHFYGHHRNLGHLDLHDHEDVDFWQEAEAHSVERLLAQS